MAVADWTGSYRNTLSLDSLVKREGAGSVKNTYNVSNNGAINLTGADNSHIYTSDFLAGGSTLSVFCWVYSTTGGTGSSVSAVSHWTGTGSQRSWRIGMAGGGNCSVSISTDGVNISDSLTPGSVPVADSNWHYIGFTFDNQILKLYRDGTNIGTKNPTVTTTLFNSTASILIGGQQGAGGPTTSLFCWPGLVDEVLITTDVISPTEATSLYNSGSGRWDAWNVVDNIAAYYHLDEGSGTSTADDSWNGRTGTLNGAGATWDTGKVITNHKVRARSTQAFGDLSTYTGVSSGATTKGCVGVWVYLNAASLISGVRLNIGSSTSNYAQATGALYAAAKGNSFANGAGWYYIVFNLSTATLVGTPNWTSVAYAEFEVTPVDENDYFNFDYFTISQQVDYPALNGLGDRITYYTVIDDSSP